MDIMMWIIVCTLACIGIACMVGDWLFVRRSRRLGKGNYRLITLYDDPVRVEEILNRCLLRLAWHGPDGAIILVDMGMGEEAMAACSRAMTELYGSFLCKPEELADTLRTLDRALEALAREAQEQK